MRRCRCPPEPSYGVLLGDIASPSISAAPLPFCRFTAATTNDVAASGRQAAGRRRRERRVCCVAATPPKPPYGALPGNIAIPGIPVVPFLLAAPRPRRTNNVAVLGKTGCCRRRKERRACGVAAPRPNRPKGRCVGTLCFPAFLPSSSLPPLHGRLDNPRRRSNFHLVGARVRAAPATYMPSHSAL
jgi:hypothetical protein